MEAYDIKFKCGVTNNLMRTYIWCHPNKASFFFFACDYKIFALKFKTQQIWKCNEFINYIFFVYSSCFYKGILGLRSKLSLIWDKKAFFFFFSW